MVLQDSYYVEKILGFGSGIDQSWYFGFIFQIVSYDLIVQSFYFFFEKMSFEYRLGMKNLIRAFVIYDTVRSMKIVIIIGRVIVIIFQ